MQTFLPYEDFDQSARTLDRLRLGKQRVEAWQIAKLLLDEDRTGKGWARHPAVLMWEGYVGALCDYGLAMCQEWVGRGYEDNLSSRFLRLALEFELSDVKPDWLGWEKFHLSHRSNLLRKNRKHYEPLFESGLSADLEYVWPAGNARGLQRRAVWRDE